MKYLWIDPAWRGWCVRAVAQVRFKPDHNAILRELDAHLQDRCRDLERIGFERALAEQRALVAMGDPEEVGKALDRAHKPWLGWLWEVSRGLVLAAVIVLLLGLMGNGGWPPVDQWLDPDPALGEAAEQVTYLDCPEPFRAGPYTIQVTEVQYDWEEAANRSWISMELLAATPEFWLGGPRLDQLLEAEDSTGVLYSDSHYLWLQSGTAVDSHWKHRCWIQLVGVSADAEWVEIRHKTAGWSFRLALPAGEEENG